MIKFQLKLSAGKETEENFPGQNKETIVEKTMINRR